LPGVSHITLPETEHNTSVYGKEHPVCNGVSHRLPRRNKAIPVVKRAVPHGVLRIFPGCFTLFFGVFHAFSGGVSHFSPGCFTLFSGVFYAFSGGVSHFSPGCFTLFSGVFYAFFRGVSLFFRACFTQFPGVFHAFFRGVSRCSPGCFVPFTGGETPRFRVRNVPAEGVDRAKSRGVARRWGESRNGVNGTPESGT
jgi:hypothetical protein